jgi:hypothetical protein
VVVPLSTHQEVVKEVEMQKTILIDKLVVAKERVEVPQPVTVIREVPFYHERIVEVNVKEKCVQEKMVELIKQVPVELIRQVSIQVPKVRRLLKHASTRHARPTAHARTLDSTLACLAWTRR